MISHLRSLWRKGPTDRLSMPSYSDLLIVKGRPCCKETMIVRHFKSTSSKCHKGRVLTRYSLLFPFDRRLSGYLKRSLDDVCTIYIFFNECCRQESYIIIKLCDERISSYLRKLMIRRSFHRKAISDHVPSRFNPFRRFNIQVTLTPVPYLQLASSQHPPPKKTPIKILYLFPIFLKRVDV